MPRKPVDIIGELGKWIGPPALKLELKTRKVSLVLDGRKRIAEIERRRLPIQIPYYRAISHYDAVRVLLLNGHRKRAMIHSLEFIPGIAEYTLNELEMLLSLPTDLKVKALFNSLQKYELGESKEAKEKKGLKLAMKFVKEINAVVRGEKDTITFKDVMERVKEAYGDDD